MNKVVVPILAAVAVLRVVSFAAEPLTRADWGAPLVNVIPAKGHWTIAGKKQIGRAHV